MKNFDDAFTQSELFEWANYGLQKLVRPFIETGLVSGENGCSDFELYQLIQIGMENLHQVCDEEVLHGLYDYIQSENDDGMEVF